MAAIGRVLLVDDNDSDNLYHRIMVERAGFQGELLCLSHGLAAWNYLQQADLRIPTLILLDLNMPEMDGFTLAARISDTYSTAPLHIALMLSPFTQAQDETRAQAWPVIRHCLTKPLTIAQLAPVLSMGVDL